MDRVDTIPRAASTIIAMSHTHPLTEWPPSHTDTPLAVLISGGLDSAVLIAEALRTYPRVYPIYVRVGSFWEATEEAYLHRYLAAIAAPNLHELTVLQQPVADLYGDHWSITGIDSPGFGTGDAESYLPGRNVLLFAKPLLWCHFHHVPELATAPLSTNIYSDASPAFYDGFAAMVNLAVGGNVRVLRPYVDLGFKKVDVLRRGVGLPLQHTFSCTAPVDGMLCGDCAKCEERQGGFRNAGIADPSRYARSMR